jgi:hypothetical protein
MKLQTFVAAISVIAALGNPVLAQTTALPKDLSGRWTLESQNRTQTFSLDGISASGPDAFTAKLTWWTTDPSCTIKAESITGRITPTGIAFDGKTKCDVSFTAELNRAASGWEGRATTTSGRQVELSLKAN